MGIEWGPQEYELWYFTPKGRLVDALEKEVIAELTQVHRGDKVLEIGCGTGHFCSFFQKQGAQVTGIDSSSKMIEAARKLYGDKGIEFEEALAEKLPFADRSFELVCLITALEFLKDPREALEEAFRVSKDKVFLGILNRRSLLAWQRKKSGKKTWQEAHFYSLKEVLNFLGKDKRIAWRGTLYLPLINSEWGFKVRLNLEKWFSKLKLPGAAFIGILAEKTEKGS